MQQGGGVLLDLDDVGKIIDIVIRGVFLFTAVAEMAAVLTADIGIGGVTRPEPGIGALVLVEDGAGVVGNEDRFAEGLHRENSCLTRSGR